MWEVTIKTFGWTKDTQFVEASVEFHCDTLDEASELVELIRKHSDINTFEIKFIGKE